MSKKETFINKKRFYIPVAILLGLVGFSPMLVSLFGVKTDEEINTDYYSSSKESLFKSKK